MAAIIKQRIIIFELQECGDGGGWRGQQLSTGVQVGMQYVHATHSVVGMYMQLFL